MFLDRCIAVIYERKVRFLTVYFLVFTVSYGVLFAFDALPELVVEESSTTEVLVESVSEESVDTLSTDEVEVAEASAVLEIAEPKAAAVQSVGVTNSDTQPVTAIEPNTPDVPISISFPALDKTVTVLNPTSRSVADLDAALLKGTVRHPDSARLDQEGNVFILGHSSYLPNVFNENFQAFNGIQNLGWGDEIIVTGQQNIYTYRVEKVYEAKASELFVPIADTGHRLTLATCDSFGSLDDRFMVEAELVGTEPRT